MATTLDINLDRSGGIVAGGSCPQGVLPALTRNDQYSIRLRVLERGIGGAYVDANLSSPSFKLGIGSIGDIPTSGEFKIGYNSLTSSAISYNATTTQVLNAISGIVGQASVEAYGSSGCAWIVTAVTTNTALSFSGITYTLFPTSSVLINTRRVPAADIRAQQVIELSRNPAVMSESFSATSSIGVVLNKIQDGSATKNEVYELTVGSDVIGGSFSLAYNNFSISTDVYTSAASLNQLLTAITGIGATNMEVKGNSKQGFIITFVNELGLQNITTPLILDSTGVILPNFYESVVTMGTVQLDEIFIEEQSNIINPDIAISINETGKTKTLYQGTVKVYRDLISSGSAAPAPISGYYTKIESDNNFVANNSTNVDSTNRVLYSGLSQKSVDYGNRSLNDSANTQQLQWGSSGVTVSSTLYTNSDISSSSVGGTKIGTTTGQKIGFFGATPVAQPTNANAISCLAQLGLFKNTTNTYGLFPQSNKTLMTLTSLNVGTLGSGDSTTITIAVTGANINDIVLLGFPAGTTTGLIMQAHASTANVVDIDVFNYSNQSKTQNALTYRISVIGY